MPERDDQLPHSPAARAERSMSPIGDRDPNESPPPSPPPSHVKGKSKGKRQDPPPLLLMVKFRQPSHEFTFGVGITFVPYPLVLTPLV
jgi:hypothetical protein